MKRGCYRFLKNKLAEWLGGGVLAIAVLVISMMIFADGGSTDTDREEILQALQAE